MIGSSRAVRVAVRFDDPSETSDHALERRILDVLSRRGVGATFAVVPFYTRHKGIAPFSAERAAHLIDAARQGIIQVALHGYTHQQWRPDGVPSEFAGVRSSEQIRLLREGREALRELFSLPIDGFIPPWNTLDVTTLHALEELEFSYVSAGWDMPPEYAGPLPLLPRTCNLPRVEQAIHEAQSLIDLSPVIILLMHHYDFAESGDRKAATDLARFDKVLEWIRLQGDVEFTFLSDLAATIPARRFVAALRQNQLRRRLHWRFGVFFPEHCLLPHSFLRSLPRTFRHGITRA